MGLGLKVLVTYGAYLDIGADLILNFYVNEILGIIFPKIGRNEQIGIGLFIFSAAQPRGLMHSAPLETSSHSEQGLSFLRWSP